MNSTIRQWLGSAKALKAIFRIFAPYVGAGIRVTHLADDFSSATVVMDLNWYNRNYVGTQFGGSLYSMTDPMYMLLLMRRLGNDYIVWDKGAEIDFVSPGRGRVTAEFHLTEERLQEIREATAGGSKALPQWTVEIRDDAGVLVATVRKTLYVRKKRQD